MIGASQILFCVDSRWAASTTLLSSETANGSPPWVRKSDPGFASILGAIFNCTFSVRQPGPRRFGRPYEAKNVHDNMTPLPSLDHNKVPLRIWHVNMSFKEIKIGKKRWIIYSGFTQNGYVPSLMFY